MPDPPGNRQAILCRRGSATGTPSRRAGQLSRALRCSSHFDMSQCQSASSWHRTSIATAFEERLQLAFVESADGPTRVS